MPICFACGFPGCPFEKPSKRMPQCRTLACIRAASTLYSDVKEKYPGVNVEHDDICITFEHNGSKFMLKVWPEMDGNNDPKFEPQCYKLFRNYEFVDNFNISELEEDFPSFLN